MNIHTIYGYFQRHFRPKRIRALKAQLPLLDDPNTTILDVGGTAAWWATGVMPATRRITIVNTDASQATACEQAGYRFLVADGRNLPFADRQFDLVHSNSVIEHVGSFEDQRRFAAEMFRCGNSIYVQTPNRWFFVEPHLITVFLHWLPFRINRHFVRWLSVWGLVTRPRQEKVDSVLHSIRLLSRDEVLGLFPGCQIQDEAFLGLTKSFVVLNTNTAKLGTAHGSHVPKKQSADGAVQVVHRRLQPPRQIGQSAAPTST